MNFPIDIPPIKDVELASRVERRWNALTKPPGSLGRLEEVVLRLALIQGVEEPSISRRAVYVFCGDHGVAAEGVSPYPPEVTRQMVLNFLNGGAAINVLARRAAITPVIVDAGVAGPAIPGTLDCKIGEGTRNFSQVAAMTSEQAERAIENGIQLATQAAGDYDICAVGEMGIGNTTSASALLCALLGVPAHEAVGRGAGLDDAGVQYKTAVVERALHMHAAHLNDAIGVAAAVGGFEIVTMAGFLIGAAQRRMPVVVDGFISTSAVLLARALAPAIGDYLLFSHRSAERGHRRMLEELNGQTLLDLDMRLGEGTGAALAIPVIDAALSLYMKMATFERAGVSGGTVESDRAHAVH
jgi:nicotinate-nucleotide--dimethylbenzimidazole phosphoribosyltransferase